MLDVTATSVDVQVNPSLVNRTMVFLHTHSPGNEKPVLHAHPKTLSAQARRLTPPAAVAAPLGLLGAAPLGAAPAIVAGSVPARTVGDAVDAVKRGWDRQGRAVGS